MLAYVDADVLAAAVPRSILYYAATLPNIGYRLTYSPYAEAQAEKNQSPTQIPVSQLRERFGWNVNADPKSLSRFSLVDTQETDIPIIAAAIHSKAKLIITANVKDFGTDDLARHKLSAVHPGLFLAHQLTASQYADVLSALGATRQREPKTPLGIHEHDIANELPQLFEQYRNLFGTPNPYQPRNPPKRAFKGNYCIICGRLIKASPGAESGLCVECYSA